jgi:hypothetical protein
MVFAKPEHIEADLIGKLDLLEEVPDAPGAFDATLAFRRFGIDVRKCVKAEFHSILQSGPRQDGGANRWFKEPAHETDCSDFEKNPEVPDCQTANPMD